LQAAALAIELATVLAPARWHRQLFIKGGADMTITFTKRAILVAAFATLFPGVRFSRAEAQASESNGSAEEVRISSEPSVALAGTLEKPHTSGQDRLPVVVIVAGTGPWTRGGFQAIRQRLLESGIAALEYDKRGQGRSTGSFVDTIPAMERDVAAAVAFLRTRPDIDPRRIALLGLSQGAVATPAVASRDPAIAAVVALSGPIGPRGELFLGIMRSTLAANGKSAASIDKVLQATSRWMDARSRSADVAETERLKRELATAFVTQTGFTAEQADDFVRTLDTPVVLSMYEVDSAKAVAAVSAPVLVIYGSRDEVIAPALHDPAARKALSGNPDAMVVTIPNLTHELARLGPDGKVIATPQTDPMDPAVVDMIGKWLRARLRPSK
jgi:uncharacterized protein